MARKTGNAPQRHAVSPARTSSAVAETTGGLQPWHLLLLGLVIAAVVSVVATRDTGAVNTVSVTAIIVTAGLVAAALVRTLGPLGSSTAGEETDMLAGRTRAALEREKMLVLRSIKEVEFDRAMRKISDADYAEVVTRLRARALGLIRQLDGGGGYRAIIERDLAALLPAAPVSVVAVSDAPRATPQEGPCPQCRTVNDRDARFCKSCGARLAEGV